MHQSGINNCAASQFLPSRESFQHRSPIVPNNFYRSSKEVKKPSPSQASNASTLSRPKLRLEGARVIESRQKTERFIHQETTKRGQGKKDSERELELENEALRQQIVELKISQFYQIDDFKLKELLLEVQSLREKIREIQQLNQSLALENDFLNRANLQLKQELKNKMIRTEVQLTPKSHTNFQNDAQGFTCGRVTGKLLSEGPRIIEKARSAKILPNFEEERVRRHREMGIRAKREAADNKNNEGKRYEKQWGI